MSRRHKRRIIEGPWYLGTCINSDRPDGSIVHGTGADYFEVAYVVQRGGDGEEEIPAILALISAAPELIAALEVARAAMTSRKGRALEQAIDVATAAITKARTVYTPARREACR